MKNLLLKSLVYFLNAEPETYKDGADGVTLSVNGTIISGKLVPRKFFYEANQNSTLNMIAGPEPSIDVDSSEIDEDVDSKVKKLTLLHLKDAFYVMGAQRIPSTGGIYIAVNIESIDAYNMGDLNIG